MRLDLVPRPHRSPLAETLAPALAFLSAVLVGGVAVSLLGVSPAAAFSVYFVAPLSELWSLQQVAVKAAPLALIATGLAFCYRANLWNIGAEGQFVIGGLAGGMVAIATHGGTGLTLWILPAMLAAGTLAGVAYAMIPALLRVRLGVSEILTSLMLVYVAELLLDYMARGPLRDPAGYNFPQSVAFDDAARLPALMEGDTLHAGVLIALAVVGLAALVLGRSLFGFEMRLVGASPRAARFAGFSTERLTLLAFAISGGAAGLAGIVEVAGRIGQLQPSISPGYGFTAIIVAFLGRLSPVGILVAAFVIAVTTIGGEAAQIDLRLPLDLTRAFQGLLLGLVLGADVLTRFRLRLVSGGNPMSPDLVAMVAATVLAAATPLIIAALGELVSERAGVLNLGVEGMMVCGAAVGFAAAVESGSTLVGALAGTGVGVALAAAFGLLTVGLAANQVASGLALNILGLGLSGLAGARYVGLKRDPAPHLDIPGLTDLPVIGRLAFGQDGFVYAGLVLTLAVTLFLWRTRSGLILRAIGDDPAATHSLGLPVRRVRYLAVLFGGGCAGLAGAYLSLAYTPFWAPAMTAGRGWIALALVVFASWRPGRVLAGAILFGGTTVLQLHAQALGIGLPGQLLSAVPYLATMLALILLSLARRQGGSLAPAALGRDFTPHR